MKILFPLLFCISFSAFGQYGLINNINTNEGLPTLTVYSVYCDRNNQVWFCTNRGLSIYNSKAMQNYSINNGLPDNEIFSVFEDKQKRIWPTSLKGELFYFLNNKIYTQKNDTALAKLNALVNHDNNNYINDIFQINDTLYFCSSLKDIYKLSPDGKAFRIKTDEKENVVTHMFFSNNRLYWFTDKGICDIYNNNKDVTPFKQEHVFETRFASNKKTTCFLYKNKIYTLNQTKIDFLFEIDLPEQINSFDFLDDETMILCSQQNVYSYNLVQKKLTHIRQFKNTCLSNLKIGKEGNCWISSLDKGVFLLNNLSYKFYSNVPVTVSEMIDYRDQLFLGYTNGTVSALDLKTDKVTDLYEQTERKVSFQSQQVRSMAVEDSTYLWLGYNFQIVKYNLRNRQTTKIPFGVKNIERDAKGKTWATCFGGIFTTAELEKHAEPPKTFNDPKLLNYRFYGFCQDSVLDQYYISRDNLFITYKNKITKCDSLKSRVSEIKTKNQKLFWILNEDKGLLVYDRKKITFVPIHTTDNLPTFCNDFCLVNDSTL